MSPSSVLKLAYTVMYVTINDNVLALQAFFLLFSAGKAEGR